MNKFILAVVLTCASNILYAQNLRFITSGSIEYEKSVNTYTILKKMFNNNMEGFVLQAFEQYKKTQPQFKVLKSTLVFSNNKTLFTPVPPEGNTSTFFNIPVAEQNNTVYSDFTNNMNIIQKLVFEETFLLKDTIRNIKWKITDETRDIAGYPCRRANGLLLDSIYVVAFYTDKIAVSGGPESFSGLPGMILQVALPHENISWLAKNITEGVIDEKLLTPPNKGKPVNRKQLNLTLEGATKNWGPHKQFYLKAFSF